MLKIIMCTPEVVGQWHRHSPESLTSAGACRYLLQLIDIEIETAKAKGLYENGVLFLEKKIRYVHSEVVWRQGNDKTKEVRCPATFPYQSTVAFRDPYTPPSGDVDVWPSGDRILLCLHLILRSWVFPFSTSSVVRKGSQGAVFRILDVIHTRSRGWPLLLVLACTSTCTVSTALRMSADFVDDARERRGHVVRVGC